MCLELKKKTFKSEKVKDKNLVWLISREEMVQFWNPAQCSTKQYTELEGVDENGPVMQNQPKEVPNQQKALLDLLLLEMDDDDDEDDEDDGEEDTY